jgi:hypothetical protein
MYQIQFHLNRIVRAVKLFYFLVAIQAGTSLLSPLAAKPQVSMQVDTKSCWRTINFAAFESEFVVTPSPP